MPATTKLDFDKFVEVAKKYNIRSENSIKGPSDQCWLNISNDLKHSISSKYAYIIVKENRNDVCSKLFPKEMSTHVENCDKITRCEESLSSSSSESCIDDTLNFNITLSANEWGSLYDNSP